MQVYLFNVKFGTLLNLLLRKLLLLTQYCLSTLKKKKREALHSVMGLTSHWLHGNSIHKIVLPLFLAWTNSPS
jgi:hypothetical protein